MTKIKVKLKQPVDGKEYATFEESAYAPDVDAWLKENATPTAYAKLQQLYGGKQQQQDFKIGKYGQRVYGDATRLPEQTIKDAEYGAKSPFEKAISIAQAPNKLARAIDATGARGLDVLIGGGNVLEKLGWPGEATPNWVKSREGYEKRIGELGGRDFWTGLGSAATDIYAMGRAGKVVEAAVPALRAGGGTLAREVGKGALRGAGTGALYGGAMSGGDPKQIAADAALFALFDAAGPVAGAALKRAKGARKPDPFVKTKTIEAADTNIGALREPAPGVLEGPLLVHGGVPFDAGKAKTTFQTAREVARNMLGSRAETLAGSLEDSLVIAQKERMHNIRTYAAAKELEKQITRKFEGVPLAERQATFDLSEAVQFLEEGAEPKMGARFRKLNPQKTYTRTLATAKKNIVQSEKGTPERAFEMEQYNRLKREMDEEFFINVKDPKAPKQAVKPTVIETMSTVLPEKMGEARTNILKDIVPELDDQPVEKQIEAMLKIYDREVPPVYNEFGKPEIEWSNTRQKIINSLTEADKMELPKPPQSKRYDQVTPEGIEKFFIERDGMTPQWLEDVLWGTGTNKRTFRDMKYRYTPEQAQAMWDAASPKVRENARWMREMADYHRARLEIDTDIEAWMHHMHTPKLRKTLEDVLRKGPFLKKRVKAGFEMKRGDVVGYERDAEKVARKYFTEAQVVVAQREFLSKVEDELAKPLGNLKPLRKGYVKYTPQYNKALKEAGKDVQVPQDARKYMLSMQNQAVFANEAAQAMYDSVKKILRDAATYWKINALMLNMGTLVTNARGILQAQLPLKTLKDIGYLAHDVVFRRGDLPMSTKQLLFDLWGVPKGAKDTIIDALSKTAQGGLTDRVAPRVAARMRTLSPDAPAFLFGDKSATGTMDLVADAAKGGALETMGRLLTPMEYIDNFGKRALLFSELGKDGRAIVDRVLAGTATDTEVTLVNEMLRVVDEFGLNYANAPDWIKRFKWASPFFNFVYQYTRMIHSQTPFSAVKAVNRPIEIASGKALRGLNGESITSAEAASVAARLKQKHAVRGNLAEKEWDWLKEYKFRDRRERLAAGMGLGMAITAAAMWKQLKYGQQPEGELASGEPGIGKVPHELSTQGRTHLFDRGDKSYYVKSTKYNPWIGAYSSGGLAAWNYIMGRPDEAARRGQDAYDTVLGDLVSVGPLVQLAAAALGYSDEYSESMTRPEKLGRVVASYTPGQRATGYLAPMVERAQEGTEGYRSYRRPGFLGKATEKIPFVSGRFKGGAKTYPNSDRFRETDAFLTNWNFWTGINLKELEKKALREWVEDVAPDVIDRDFVQHTIEPLDSSADIPALRDLRRQILSGEVEGYRKKMPPDLRDKLARRVTQQINRIQETEGE